LSHWEKTKKQKGINFRFSLFEKQTVQIEIFKKKNGSELRCTPPWERGVCFIYRRKSTVQIGWLSDSAT
jgi:hypothetical protein